jgi:hypothetical protein
VQVSPVNSHRSGREFILNNTDKERKHFHPARSTIEISLSD